MMRLIHTTRVVGGLLLVASASWAQQGTISGRITASGSGEPVAMARVIAVGTPASATSGQDGRYILKHVPLGTVTLQVLKVGFQARKKDVSVPEAGTASLDIDIAPTVVKLAEVVTTGAGEQPRLDVRPATRPQGVADRVEKSATDLTIGDLLVQKAPGMTVLQQGM